MLRFPRTLTCTLLLLAAATLAAAAPAGAAPSLQQWPGALPDTDGDTTAAWRDGDTMGVLRDDQEAGAARVFPLPPGCTSVAPRAPVTGLLCGSALRLLDTTTGAITAVPHPEHLRSFMRDNSANGEDFTLDRLGSALAEVRASSSRTGDYWVRVDLRTGRLRDFTEPSAREVASLDHAGGTGPLCAPLRVPVVAITSWDGARYRQRAPAVYRAPYLVTVRGGRAALRRCSHATALTLGASFDEPVLTARYVAWASPTRLTIRLHTTGQRLVFPLAEPSSGVIAPRLSGTARRLWLAYGPQVRVVDLGAG